MPPATQPDHFNALGQGKLPGHLGMTITGMSPGQVTSELAVRDVH